MSEQAHLIVETGPARGREVRVPPAGIRLGRSSRNDCSIEDVSLSRFHCRFYFEADGSFWAADLGSSNGTLVNGQPIQERRLNVGDTVTIGDTGLRVLKVEGGGAAAPDAGTAIPPPPAALRPPIPAATAGDVPVDLGLRPPAGRSARMPPLRRVLLAGVALMAAAVAAVWGWRWIQKHPRATPPETVLAEPPSAIELRYEKVEASTSNIFRYALSIQKNRMHLQVDDLLRDRHIRGREKSVDPDLLRSLARDVAQKGFFDLQDEYRGSATDVYDSFDLSITLSRRTHRVQVVNLVEPEAFAAVQGLIEEFAKTELGTAALPLEPRELIVKAEESVALGKRLYEAREVRPGNLSDAIRAFQEGEWYLETIDPKPAFYADAVSGRTECEKELQKKFENLSFLVERATKLRDWKEAARQLRIVIELIPDRSDDRNKSANRKLVEIERHLAEERS